MKTLPTIGMVQFRQVRAIPDLEKIVDMQQKVWGFRERECVPMNVLRVLPKTGGDVFGAYQSDALIGFVFGWGGIYQGTPQIVSHMLAVAPQFQSSGIGRELKLLQACLAMVNGFRFMTWTWDPLRSLNARLNFERLGIIVREYLVDYYGQGIATGLYAGMPTDRFVAEWDLGNDEVLRRLRGDYMPLTLDEITQIPVVTVDDLQDHDVVRVEIPPDIDAVRGPEPTGLRKLWPPAIKRFKLGVKRAIEWRLRIRTIMKHYLTENGYTVTGFATGKIGTERRSYYVLEKNFHL